MNETDATPVVRVKIPCADRREFLERFAPRYAHAGVFVPTERARPVGSRIHLKLEFRDGDVGVSGEALVTGHGASKAGGPGMLLRFTSLHPGSVQFELSPAGGGVPAPTPSPQMPLVPPQFQERAREELADELFGPDFPEDEPLGSATPLEVRTEKVKLKLKETLREPDSPPAAAAAARATPPPLAGAAEPVEATPAVVLETPDRPAPRARIGPVVAVLGLAVLAAGGLAIWGAYASRQGRERVQGVEAELRTADARLAEGKLADPPGDSALDHLLAAKRLAPDDREVVSRLKAAADSCERLAVAAVARGDLGDAAVKLQAAARADPDRASIGPRLAEVQQRLSEASRAQ